MTTVSSFYSSDPLDDLGFDEDDEDEGYEEQPTVRSVVSATTTSSHSNNSSDSLISADEDLLTREEEIKLATLIQSKPGGLSALNKKTRGLHKLCESNVLYFGKSKSRRRKKFQNKVDRWKKLTPGEYLVVLADLSVPLSPPLEEKTPPKKQKALTYSPVPATVAAPTPSGPPVSLAFSPITNMKGRAKPPIKIPAHASKLLALVCCWGCLCFDGANLLTLLRHREKDHGSGSSRIPKSCNVLSLSPG